MKKRPKPPVLVSGGAVRGLGPVPVGLRKQPPRRRPRKPSRVQPGGPVIGLGPAKKKPVRRKLALGEAVACCAAEALAASLRLAGHPVSDRDVLALYELTAGDSDEGATISATLQAAQRYGLAGWRPARITEVREPGTPRPRSRGEQEVQLSAFQLGELDSPAAAVAVLDSDEPSLLAGLDGDGSDAGVIAGAVLTGLPARDCLPCHGSSVILGLDLPEGPHAILDDGTAWWSWGQRYGPADFPGAVIGEAWEIRWL